jgi:hypothetical protein
LGVKILKFFDEDPGSRMETVRIRDPGWIKVGSVIRDKHPGSATLGIKIHFYDVKIIEARYDTIRYGTFEFQSYAMLELKT